MSAVFCLPSVVLQPKMAAECNIHYVFTQNISKLFHLCILFLLDQTTDEIRGTTPWTMMSANGIVISAWMRGRTVE